MFQPKQVELVVQGKTFAAELWGDQGEPVIALHGWLDNCFSFRPLAPLLKNIQLLAIDMAGHGHSDHRSADASYHIWDDVREVLLLANEMGWNKFSLLGHSRGAIIAALIGAVALERVHKIALIEGLRPMTQTDAQAPIQLKKFIDRYLGTTGLRKGRADLDRMIRGRMQSGYGLSEPSARLLVTRNVEVIDGYYYWRTDSRLTIPSPQMLTGKAAQAFIEQVRAPALLITGDRAMGKEMDWESVLQDLPFFDVKMLTGGHHLHMEEAVSQVASEVNSFFRAGAINNE